MRHTQYRLAWIDRDGSVHQGPLNNSLKSLINAEKFGNANDGHGSHWIERYDGRKWVRYDAQQGVKP